MGIHRTLSNKDRQDMIKRPVIKKWDGKDRRKAISTFVEPYHERRRDGQRHAYA